jgi:hypothetical protein
MSHDPLPSAIPPLPDHLSDEDAEPEATAFIARETAPPPLPEDGGSDPASVDLPDRPRTNTGLDIQAFPDGSETELGRAGLAAREAADLRRRAPAPRRRRPTLLPGELPPKLPSARRTVDPGLVAPVRAAPGSSRPDLVGRSRESSDIIQTFHSNEDSSKHEPRPIAGQANRPRPRPLRPKKQLQRKPARPAPRPQRPSGAVPPTVSMQPQAPSILPLNPDVLAVHIADQRRRLHVVDGFARALEVAAGILGTLALACLIAALVSILVGSDVSVLTAAAALVGSLCALGLTLLMVVGAIGLRQVAHNSAQTAALLESLSGYRR